MATDNDIGTFFREHVGLLLTLSFFAVAGLRILGVANFQTDTAMRLANSAGLPTVVFASALALAGLVPFVLLMVGLVLYGRGDVPWLGGVSIALGLLLGYYMLSVDGFLTLAWLSAYIGLERWRRRNRQWSAHVMFAISIMTVAVLMIARLLETFTGFPGLLWLALFFAGYHVYLGVQRSLGRPESVPEPWPSSRGLQAISGGLWLFLILSSPQPWLPVEVVTVNGDDLVGYVIEENGPWMTFLDEPTRTVSQIDLEQVGRRVVCVMARNRGMTMDQRLSNRLMPTSPPLCSDV